jgi:hypothetical protein
MLSESAAEKCRSISNWRAESRRMATTSVRIAITQCFLIRHIAGLIAFAMNRRQLRREAFVQIPASDYQLPALLTTRKIAVHFNGRPVVELQHVPRHHPRAAVANRDRRPRSRSSARFPPRAAPASGRGARSPRIPRRVCWKTSRRCSGTSLVRPCVFGRGGLFTVLPCLSGVGDSTAYLRSVIKGATPNGTAASSASTSASPATMPREYSQLYSTSLPRFRWRQVITMFTLRRASPSGPA